MYDVAIIGGGAAGVSAALTLQALKKNFIWFADAKLSEKIRKAELIRNYPGLSSVTGSDFAAALAAQITEIGIAPTQKTVTGVYALGEYFALACDKETFEAKTVILATGVEAVKPIVGELELLGRGVSYCATCDGFLYKGKNIAVVSTSKAFEHEVEYLSQIAKKVYFTALYKDVGTFGENVERIVGVPTAVEGEKKASALVFKDKRLEVDGVFFLKNAITPSTLVPGLDMENGHVKVDRACKTNLSGLFAAGDCTGRPYQYAKAVGEGNVAAHTAIEYLSKSK